MAVLRGSSTVLICSNVAITAQTMGAGHGHHPAAQWIDALRLIQPGLEILGSWDEARRGSGDGHPSLGQVVRHLHEPVEAAGMERSALQRNAGVSTVGEDRRGGVETEGLQLGGLGDLVVGIRLTEEAPAAEAHERIAVPGLRATTGDVRQDQAADLSPGLAWGEGLGASGAAEAVPVEPRTSSCQAGLGLQQQLGLGEDGLVIERAVALAGLGPTDTAGLIDRELGAGGANPDTLWAARQTEPLKRLNKDASSPHPCRPTSPHSGKTGLSALGSRDRKCPQIPADTRRGQQVQEGDRSSKPTALQWL